MELLLKSSQVFSCRKMVYTPHHVATVWAQPFCYYGNNVACHSSTCFTCELYVLALFSPLLTPPPSSHLPPPHTYPLLTPTPSSHLPPPHTSHLLTPPTSSHLSPPHTSPLLTPTPFPLSLSTLATALLNGVDRKSIC